MKFKNPANGYVEECSSPWLWALLFGGFYFIAAGLWIPIVLWILLATLLFAALGPPATFAVILLNLIYAGLAGGMVRASFLRRGWSEVSVEPTSDPYHKPAFSERVFEPKPNRSDGDKTRQCPFCAETIRAAAILCRYCGKDLPRGVEVPLPHELPPQDGFDTSTPEKCIRTLVALGYRVAQREAEVWAITNPSGVTAFARSLDDFKTLTTTYAKQTGSGSEV